jgi:hypothetical protein
VSRPTAGLGWAGLGWAGLGRAELRVQCLMQGCLHCLAAPACAQRMLCPCCTRRWMVSGASAVQPVAAASLEPRSSDEGPLPPPSALGRLQLPDVSLRSLWTGLFRQVGRGEAAALRRAAAMCQCQLSKALPACQLCQAAFRPTPGSGHWLNLRPELLIPVPCTCTGLERTIARGQGRCSPAGERLHTSPVPCSARTLPRTAHRTAPRPHARSRLWLALTAAGGPLCCALQAGEGGGGGEGERSYDLQDLRAEVRRLAAAQARLAAAQRRRDKAAARVRGAAWPPVLCCGPLAG